jgi:hypothetical protein
MPRRRTCDVKHAHGRPMVCGMRGGNIYHSIALHHMLYATGILLF